MPRAISKNPESSIIHHRSAECRSAMARTRSNVPLSTSRNPNIRARIPKVCNGSRKAAMPASANTTPRMPCIHFHPAPTPMSMNSVMAPRSRKAPIRNPMVAAESRSKSRTTTPIRIHAIPLTSRTHHFTDPRSTSQAGSAMTSDMTNPPRSPRQGMKPWLRARHPNRMIRAASGGTGETDLCRRCRQNGVLLLGGEALAGVEADAAAVEHWGLDDGHDEPPVLLRATPALREGSVLGEGLGELVGDAGGDAGAEQARGDGDGSNTEAAQVAGHRQHHPGDAGLGCGVRNLSDLTFEGSDGGGVDHHAALAV